MAVTSLCSGLDKHKEAQKKLTLGFHYGQHKMVDSVYVASDGVFNMIA